MLPAEIQLFRHETDTQQYRGADTAPEKVIVAVRAEKEISKTALAWALTHVVRPRDCITLLAVFSGDDKGLRRWSFPKFSRDCASGHRKSSLDRRCQISESCSQMVLQFHGACDPNEINVRIKVVSAKPAGAVAAESKRAGANWVVLDKWTAWMKDIHHGGLTGHRPPAIGWCRESSQSVPSCWYAVVFDMVLRIRVPAASLFRSETSRTPLTQRLKHPRSLGPPYWIREIHSVHQTIEGGGASLHGGAPMQHSSNETFKTQSPQAQLGGQHEPGLPYLSPSQSDDDKPLENRIKHSTPISSPEEPKPSVMRSVQASVSSRDMGNSPFFVCEENPLFEGFRKGESSFREETVDWDDAVTSFGSDGEGLSPPSKHPLLVTTHGRGYRESSTIDFERSQQYPSSHPSHKREVYWIPQNHVEGELKNPVTRYSIATHNTKPPIAKTLLERFAEFDQEAGAHRLSIDQTPHRDYVFNSNVRDAVHLFRNSPSVPPPLCSICQHKVPVFGKPPRWFSYGELDDATDGFSEENFLAEGGFGSVHRGVLGDGQVVAVKQLKVASSQGDAEFCAEVEVLSCAQHRNVVMLIGFCIEEKRRVLVYEYICNGSLDFHLYGHNRAPLDWHARMKIAIGAARGLRYLHEDCRVGCIVHRDMRPNNILVTHDFEPLVGDFGLARWHPNGNLDVETRVIGTFGYLAPEYAESGRITEKTDVYAFGVVLLELITGQKAINMTRPKGQQFLVEWARPLLDSDEGQTIAIDQLLDPRLDLYELQFETHQLQAMAYAASLCLRRDPLVRPSMSKVLRVLEGDVIIDSGFDLDSVGNRTERMNGLILYRHASCNVDSVGSRSRRMNGLNLQRHASCDANSIGSRSECMNGLSLQQLIGFSVDSVSSRSRRMNCPSLQLHCSTTPDSIGNRSERMNNSRFQLQVEPREGRSRKLSLGTPKPFYAEKDSNHHGIY